MMIVNNPKTRPATGFDSELSVRAVTATTWSLLAPLIWTGTKGQTFTVPVGFVTDFATVPRALVWKVQTYGPYTRAAVLHDWLLTELARWAKERDDRLRIHETTPPAWTPPANSRDSDGIFRRVMQDLGVSWLTRWQMWAAVRVASLFNNRRAYGRRFLKDAPAVLGVLLLSAPFLLPGTVGVLISLALSWPFTRRRTRAAVAPNRKV